MSFTEKTGKSWIEKTFFKKECVKFIPSSVDLHRCIPVCQVCQNLIRCCCGHLLAEHSWKNFISPLSFLPGPGHDVDEVWSLAVHTKSSPTDAYGIVNFEDTATRVCRAKYVRVAVDSKPEALLQLMLREWQMEKPKLLLTVHGGSDNFILPPKVKQAFSKGLITAALSTGAWILTDGINTGVSRYVGEAVKLFGGHQLKMRNTVGFTPWGMIDNNMDLIGRDVFRPYQPLGNPLSKKVSLNGFHSHFLLVDDGTVGKHGCQQDLRRKLEKHIQLQRIHPRLNQRVPVVCVVVEGGPTIVPTVLDYVSSVPPVPVFVFEGSGRAADLLAFLHKQTANNKELEADIKEDFLDRIGLVFGVEKIEATNLYTLLLQCMNYRDSITIFDSESEDHLSPDVAILSTTLRGTKTSPAGQLSMALAWDRVDIAQKDVLVCGQHWQAGTLEQAMLDALVMDRVGFVKLLIDNGMTMTRFLTVDRLEELYNTPQGQTQRFLHHLVEDAKQTSVPTGYHLSLIDMGLVIEYLIGGAYCSTYTRKHFRAVYNHLHDKKRGFRSNSKRRASLPDMPFFRTAQPYKRKEQDVSPGRDEKMTPSPELDEALLRVPFNFNDLFVWAVLQQRQQMALFLWQHGEEALARALVACKLYRSMAFEAQHSSMYDNVAERFKAYSLEFGQLAVDMLDYAFRQNEQMAMKLLTSEMEAWSHFTCLQLAVSSCHRPFVYHSCTQTLLTDLWSGPLNMRKNSVLKIILSLLLPPAIVLLEFKSKAEMCHVPQTHEAMLFGLDSVKSVPATEGSNHLGGEQCRPSSSDKCFGTKSEFLSRVTVQDLFWITRLYDFYTAPVVKYWFHTLSYLIFLMLFSYVVLVKMEDKLSVQEWLVIAFIVTTAAEKTREVLMSEPRSLSQKLKIWFSEYWNISDFIAILLFLVGLMMRWHSDPYRTAGRISYCLDIIFWFIKVMDLLAVNQHAGPYLTIITKMTSNMFYIVVMMAIVLLTFGVSRKAILSPDEEPSWHLARDIVFQPYWMIFGEVYAGELDPCENNDQCPPASFLAPLLQAVYMFFQYIIMVNVLIAFFNNVYFDMASTSNNLWKYNRYRYIMTYQERLWLPPPLIFLSHLAFALKSLCRKFNVKTKQKERGSGLKLYLGNEDLKKLHEFEEKCIEAYFHEKTEDLHSSQINRMRATAERAEEMCVMTKEVSEKVNFIQDNLSELDSQLGQLQDLSVLAVDMLTLLSASDTLHQKKSRLAHGRLSKTSKDVLPHSWTLSDRTEVYSNSSNMQQWKMKLCKSTPPSLLKGSFLITNRLTSEDCCIQAKKSGVESRQHTETGEETSEEGSQLTTFNHLNENWSGISRTTLHTSHQHFYISGGRDLTPSESCDSSRCGSPLSPRSLGSPQYRPWTWDLYLYPSQEETSMEEKEEEENDDEKQEKGEEKEEDVIQKQLENTVDHRSRYSYQWRRPRFSPRWPNTFGERPYGHTRSLSSSMENIYSVAPHSPVSGSFPHLNEDQRNKDRWFHKRSFDDDTSLRRSRSREWSKSSEFLQVLDKRGKSPNRKTVKIKENSPDRETRHAENMSADLWRGHPRLRGKPKSLSASTSLNQLYFDSTDLLQKQVLSPQEMWSPTHSAWTSWARSMSRRSSLQSGMAPEAKSTSFQDSDTLYPHYSAMERNNLMRLAHTIPFTPVSIFGGEEVSVYSLDEIPSDTYPEASSVSSWSSRGLSAMLQPLLSEEGSLDGGIRQGCRMLCTWAEQDVLTPGLVYVVKAFKPEVVRAWQRYFHGSTALQLCLREIQQQRAAQKMMNVFNQIKLEEMHHSPRFLEVFLVLWHSNGQWLTIERNMAGDFRKYNNNTGEEITPCCSLEDLLLAFSHWTYEYSCGELLVLDIQGAGEELTDPTVIMADDQSNSGEILFGPDNLGDAAINSFRQKHNCNFCCRRLGLKDLRRRQDSGENDKMEGLQRDEEQDSNESKGFYPECMKN